MSVICFVPFNSAPGGYKTRRGYSADLKSRHRKNIELTAAKSLEPFPGSFLQKKNKELFFSEILDANNICRSY